MNDEEVTQNQRLGQALDFMVETLNLAPSRKGLAKVLGLSESLVSLVANDRQAVSEKFLDAIARVAPMVSREWITTGNGSMVEQISTTTATAEDPTVKRQQELIKQATETLNNMIAKGLSEALITRQMDIIDALQKTLNSMESKSKMQGAMIVDSTVDSFKDNVNSLNGSLNGSGKRRGRKTNTSKSRNSAPEFDADDAVTPNK